MELILIACSGKKNDGGTRFLITSNVVEILPVAEVDRLFDARSQLASSLNLPNGPDFSHYTGIENLNEYMPAYKRYKGKMYQRCQFENYYPRLVGYKVLIISALYGVIEADNYIRNYDLQMNSNLPGIGSVWNFWKTKHLGRIVEKIITEYNPSIVHDFLSHNYRKALSPWPPNNLIDQNHEFKKYDYPGLGMESLWRRGDDIKNLFNCE